MPFEIAPKEVSLAEKLAALIEAGRAAHPNMRHIRRHWTDVNGGCALTFAGLALGIDRADVSAGGIAYCLGVDFDEFEELACRVIDMNDDTTASLDEIIAAIRENKLPERKGYFDNMVFTKGAFKPFMTIVSVGQVIYFGTGYASPDKWEKFVPKSKPVPKPLNVRVNAKTGATWPEPKHCYA